MIKSFSVNYGLTDINLYHKDLMINDLQRKLIKQSDENEIRIAQLLNQKILTDDDW